MRQSPLLLLCLLPLACIDDRAPVDAMTSETDATGDGDPSGDGDGDPSGDGDGDPSGDGDGDPSGDGDGDPSGDGDPGDCELGELLTQAIWDEMFLHEDDPACFGSVYTREGLLDAAVDYPSFACEGDEATRRRELAAFLAQISHETTGGWAAAPDGPYSWGLCFIEEVGCENNGCPQYCDPNNAQYPCAPGKTYHGRGAIQLSWNYNYGQAGDALGVDLLGDPDLVKTDSKLAIQTAMWFWMTEQRPKPSAHDVMAGNWTPSPQDEALGRLPGFGMTTNIINGGLECSMPGNSKVEDRVGFFERYADLLTTDVGANVYCDMMTPY
jgi:basic endochitinase B